jgi:hypothetical protein
LPLVFGQLVELDRRHVLAVSDEAVALEALHEDFVALGPDELPQDSPGLDRLVWLLELGEVLLVGHLAVDPARVGAHGPLRLDQGAPDRLVARLLELPGVDGEVPVAVDVRPELAQLLPEIVVLLERDDGLGVARAALVGGQAPEAPQDRLAGRELLGVFLLLGLRLRRVVGDHGGSELVHLLRELRIELLHRTGDEGSLEGDLRGDDVLVPVVDLVVRDQDLDVGHRPGGEPMRPARGLDEDVGLQRRGQEDHGPRRVALAVVQVDPGPAGLHGGDDHVRLAPLELLHLVELVLRLAVDAGELDPSVAVMRSSTVTCSPPTQTFDLLTTAL